MRKRRKYLREEHDVYLHNDRKCKMKKYNQDFQGTLNYMLIAYRKKQQLTYIQGLKKRKGKQQTSMFQQIFHN